MAIRAAKTFAAMRMIICSGDLQTIEDHEKEFGELRCELLFKPFAVEDFVNLVKAGVARFPRPSQQQARSSS